MLRKRVMVAAAVVVMAASTTLVRSPVGAQPLATQPFAAYGTGSTVGLNAVQLGNSQVANVQAAFAGQSVNSTGLSNAIVNELGFAVQPPQDGKNAYGRGTGLEVGVLTPVPGVPDPNQVLLAGLAEANAAPPSDLVTKEIGPVPLDPVAFANVLRGQAQAVYDPNVCAIGQPLAFGQGEAAGLQLVNLGGTGENGELLAPLAGLTDDPDRNVSQTRSYSYLIPNGDGSFGLVSEVRQTMAPVNLLDGAVSIELLGEWALRAIATGLPGGARMEYAPVGATPTTNVAVINVLGLLPTTVTFQQILGPNGFELDLAPIVTLRLGAPPRPIGGSGPAPVAGDGTSASGAVDVLQLTLLDVPGLGVLDLRLGHMEAAVQVPAGGIECSIPVSKSANPDPLVLSGGAGETDITISVPPPGVDLGSLFACDLQDIRIDDVHSADPNLTVRVVSATNGGIVSQDGKSVSWPNLGSLTPDEDPLEVTVRVRVTGRTAGLIRDTANVTASLGNCRGGAAGEDLVGVGSFEGSTITGSVTLEGPRVDPGPAGPTLPPTGNDPILPMVGGGLALLGLALRRKGLLAI